MSPQFEYTVYHNPYASSIAETLARRGDIEAHAAAASGQAWAGAVQQAGNTIAALPQQMQQQAAQTQETDARNLQIQHAKRATEIQDAAESAYQQIKGGNAEAVLSQLRPEVRAVAEGWLNDFAKSKQARDTQATADAKRAAKMIQALGYDPVVAATSMKVLGDVYPEAKDLLAHVNSPEALKQIVDHFATFGDEPAKLVDHDPTKDLVDPTTGEVRRPGTPAPAKPPTVTYGQPQTQMVNGKRALVRAGSDGKLYDANTAEVVTATPEPEKAPTGVNAPGNVKMTPEASDYAATQIRLTNNMAVLNRLDDDDRKTILNRVAEQTKALGQTPAAAIQKQFALKADGAALTKMTAMKASAEAFEGKAIAQTDLIKDLSAKVNRTAWPIVNSAILAGQTTVAGDENASKLVNAVTTFAAEYAKIMEGSTGSVSGSSDSARRASERLVRAAMNKTTLPAVLDQMKWEMRQTGLGYDATIDHITERMGGAPPAATPAADDSGWQTVNGIRIRVKK